MLLAQKTYNETVIGGVGTMTYGGMVSVGLVDDGSGYESFAAFVRDLEAMERQGLVRIESKHLESQTGKRHVDMVRFTRLK